MNAVELNDVKVVFRRKGGEPFEAIKRVSFDIPKGSIFCLLGPNGSGKTTCINLINGLLRPSAGEVRVAGVNPSKNRTEVFRKIALVPQETALYNDLSARENLIFHGNYYGLRKDGLHEKIDQVLALVHLAGRQHDRVYTYSGGMQRRLSLARALLTSPEILLLDEPTLGVDVQSRNSIWERIKEIAAEGTTVLLTTNYMEEAEALGHFIYIIDRGEPVIAGTPSDLKRQLDNKQFIVTFLDTVIAKQASQSLQTLYEVGRAENQVKIKLPEKSDTMAFMKRITEALTEYSDSIISMELKEPNLQEVFLHHTGRALRD